MLYLLLVAARVLGSMLLQYLDIYISIFDIYGYSSMLLPVYMYLFILSTTMTLDRVVFNPANKTSDTSMQ